MQNKQAIASCYPLKQTIFLFVFGRADLTLSCSCSVATEHECLVENMASNCPDSILLLGVYAVPEDVKALTDWISRCESLLCECANFHIDAHPQ